MIYLWYIAFVQIQINQSEMDLGVEKTYLITSSK
jgi:hypothetical protein